MNWLLVWDPGKKELEVWGWSTSWPGDLMLAGRQSALPPIIGGTGWGAHLGNSTDPCEDLLGLAGSAAVPGWSGQ